MDSQPRLVTRYAGRSVSQVKKAGTCILALICRQVYLLVGQPQPVGLLSQSAQAGRQVHWSVSQH